MAEKNSPEIGLWSVVGFYGASFVTLVLILGFFTWSLACCSGTCVDFTNIVVEAIDE